MCPSEYTSAVDIWSAGCIFAELLGRKPIFPGRDETLDMINKIMGVLGTPTSEDLEFVKDEISKGFILKQEKKQKKNLHHLFPYIKKKEAIDLLTNMLVFNPQKRFDAKQCLMHKYFDNIRDQDFIDMSNSHFDWDFDDIELNKELIQTLIYEESLSFHPESNKIAKEKQNETNNKKPEKDGVKIKEKVIEEKVEEKPKVDNIDKSLNNEIEVNKEQIDPLSTKNNTTEAEETIE